MQRHRGAKTACVRVGGKTSFSNNFSTTNIAKRVGGLIYLFHIKCKENDKNLPEIFRTFWHLRKTAVK